MASKIADVLIPLALDTAYSYAVPDGLALEEGDVVQVPLANREVAGVVWGLRDGQGGNLKKVTGVIEAPNLSPRMRKFLDWIAWYTLAPKGSALAMGLKIPDPDRQEVARVGVRLAGALPKRMTPARQKVVEIAQDGIVRLKSELAHAAGVSSGVVNGLIDEGTLETVALLAEPVAEMPDPAFGHTALSDGQREAAHELVAAMGEEHPPVILLEGVTGSGKTEVYFEAVAEAVRAGRQALILMPEIALTAQFLDRFAARFGVKPATWHSGVTGRRRERLYAAIAAGEVKVVAGARSALFLPYADLGLVIVDEEHETAYKQDDGVHYHARDMAVVRGKIENAPVVLASATPSIESRVNVERGRYRHVRLPERFGGRSMPQIRAVDLRREAIPKGRWLSPALVTAVEDTVARGEQALLFLNRRGYAPLTLCRACAHRYECPNCSSWLVEHRFRRSLVCHHCGHVERTPHACVECGSVDSLVPCGPGVERIAEEAAELFPDKRCIVLSSDFPGGTERLRTELAAIAAGEFDIVIGTQLVAKGHNFPLMTLVGVLDADIGLTSGDPRAAERTFQMLQQVTGRAGRGEKPGRALVQTWQPDHPVIAALISGDAERFYAEETRVREMAGLPPFGRLASLIVSAAEREAAEAHARAMALVAEPPPGVTVLGPAEAPLALIRGRYRFRLLVKTEREVDLQAYLRGWMARSPKIRGNTRVSIDVDPQSFL
ncbi:primosomal protein N' [Microvirga tunisiensis]|uniref:Replication restart protein PriA n=1 Tax=Microvirga tunisiensis TaxID=2108360 RepID=A0A5N7MEH1_9HYPH|nr:primosomal protein N' [Microvirga tunisiensis]MPR06527.1 primosomal protein N' [Microvirga tunisiensis]MPR24649.1 primosomal protein N' [Microvirga tunisiensis]